jgi:multidrug efflux system membrane fusion protein
MSRWIATAAQAFLLTAALSGCAEKAAPPAPPEMTVSVSTPVERVVTDHEDFTGNTQGVQSVDIKARVSGYLAKINFKAGDFIKGGERPEVQAAAAVGMLAFPAVQAHAMVAATLNPEQGDILFEIDKRPYQADYDRANGELLVAKAQLKLAVANNLRAKELSKTPGAISQKELDTYQAKQEVADAQVISATSNLETYRLNLTFCTVRAPFDGKVSRNLPSVGALIAKDETVLTTLITVDPMFVYFQVDENTLLRVIDAIRSGKMKPVRQGQIRVFMSLANEQDYPHEGLVDFINNTVDRNTGTITLRGVYANPKSKDGPPQLVPGMFVRVRLPTSDPYKALLVSDKAIGTDQGLKYVYVVAPDGKVKYQRITMGALQDDGLRVVEGVQPTDRVIIDGLQLVRPDQVVKTDLVPMPTVALPVRPVPPLPNKESADKDK